MPQGKHPHSLANLIPGGNPSGRPKSKLFRRYSMRHLLGQNEASDKKRIEELVENQVDLACSSGKNAVAAATFLRDTVDGRPESSDATAQAAVQINVSYAPVAELDKALEEVQSEGQH